MVKNDRMTKRALLTIGLTTGAYLGWRARGGSANWLGSAASARPSDARAAGSARSTARVEKARAMVDLSRERALQAIDQVLHVIRDAA